MLETNYKEVAFEEYCRKCDHWDTQDWDPPCDICRCTAMRECTKVPLKFREKEKKS
jgi:hypothetical protein